MNKWAVTILIFLFFLNTGVTEMWAQAQGPAQKRILMERGEKVRGQRLAHQDFTLVIRDAKKMIIVVTADGIVSFDY